MYRGNTPGQYNGSRLPTNTEYNAAFGMSGPGQGPIRGPSMQGHSAQAFQNQPYSGTPSQMQYRTPQGASIAFTDPYAYNQRKVSTDSQHSMSGVSYGGMPPGDIYGGAQTRPPANYAAGGSSEFPVVQGNNIPIQQYSQSKQMSVVPSGWNKPASDSTAMVYRTRTPSGNASSMYNGSQYRTSISSIQAGVRQSDPTASSIRHSMQASSFLGSETSVRMPGGISSYPQQASSIPSQFQQGPGSGTTAHSQPSAYMQQQYMNQPRSSGYTASQPTMQGALQQPQGSSNVRSQFEDPTLMMSQQNALQQAMKQSQGYHLTVPSSNTGGALPQAGQPQMMSVTGNPMQQAMSPHHPSPLSPPVRAAVASRSNIVPPASPQLQTSRTTPQYPAPQVSPHIHQTGSMSPSARHPSYSPKQQMGTGFANQSAMKTTFKANQAPRPTGRNDASGRGFMSPSRLMSPPPSSMQTPNITLNQSSRLPMSYNGDSSMQQYFSQPSRFPQAWQGVRQQTPTPSNQGLQSTSGNMLSSSQVPRPSRYGVPQQMQQTSTLPYAGQAMQMSHSGYQPIQNAPSSANTNQQSRTVLPQPSTTVSLGMPAQNDFDNEFNLDSLLNDPSDGIGSFMQQLQDVAPTVSSSSLTTSQILPIPEPSLSSNNAVKMPANNQLSSAPPPQVLSSAASTQHSMPSQSIASMNIPVNKSTDSSNMTGLPLPNISLNSEESKLDSGEITLESTEQELLKAASSVPRRFADSNLPDPGSALLSEIKEPIIPLSVSQASTAVTSSPAQSMSSVLPTTTHPTAALASASLIASPGGHSMIDSSSARKLSKESTSDRNAANISLTMPQVVSTAPASQVPVVPASISVLSNSGNVSASNQINVEQTSQINSAMPSVPRPAAVSMASSVSFTAVESSSQNAAIPSQPPVTAITNIQNTSVPNSFPIPTPTIQPSIGNSTPSSLPGPVNVRQPGPAVSAHLPFSNEFPPNLTDRPTVASGSYPAPHSTSQAMSPSSISGPCPVSVPGNKPTQAAVVPGQPGRQPDHHQPKVVGETPGYPPRPPMMGVSSQAPQPGHPLGPRMRALDGSVIRTPGAPRYPGMHPRYQQHRPYGPHGPYGPHPQPTAGPYPSSSAHPNRPPFNQSSPHMPRGPRPEYMGPRPPYRPMLTPQQQQHLQQQLQGLKMESQQLHYQLQRVQQEEIENKPEGTIPPPEQQPRKSDQIRRRLMELDHNMKQISMQLFNAAHHRPVAQLQDPNQPMPPHHPTAPIFGEGDTTGGAEDSAKKKRIRKQKTKVSKGEGEDSKKPPRKKKKKDSEGEPGSEKKKKKTKKVEKIESFPDTDSLDIGADSSQDGQQGSSIGDDGDSLGDESYVPPEFVDSPVKSDKTKPKKRKPYATVVKPKKKRKRGYDSSDEMNAVDTLQSTPPPSPEDSLIEKRRSGRNVKRKRYVESVDLSFSGDDEDSDMVRQSKKNQQIVELTEMDDVMIVDKILSHRKRRTKIKKKSVSEEEGANSNREKTDVETDDAVAPATSAEVDDSAADSSKQAEGSAGESGPILSPTSLKNPRIRKFSLGVEQNEEEVVDENAEDEYFVKYKNYSYLHCDWKTKSEIEDKRFDQKLKRYIAKNTAKDGQLIYPEHEADELFNPDFVEVDRVLDVMQSENDEEGQATRHFLIKWCSLPYEDSTWEQEEDIEKVKIEEFEARCRYRPPRRRYRPEKETWKRLSEDNTRFCSGNVLRDYQFEGLNWLLFNWYHRRNCILADEMGLGKTIQSITFLQKIFDYGIQGPFLVVAPLSTIANWQREFASWTTINAVVYHGSQTSRDMIHTYEWFCRDEKLDEIEGCYKMHAVITTYEMVVLDSPHLRDVEWKCLIIDEAHRLKNNSCKLVESLRGMQLEHKVLLTGTPLQNNVEELFALLTFLQPDTFNCQQTFLLEFGNLKDNAQVEKLQELLKPMMLRRLKEDVEKSLAPKQETIIEVELTNIQKKYYRAILERNFEFLSKGTSGGNVPNLMNTMMELRKCCNHPYLIKGAEDKIMQEEKDIKGEFNSLQAMIQSSGKLVLIDKLLPKLKEADHKVLIFSQMVRVLDILEDYLVQRSYAYERIDGCIRGNERQMAIDRFSKKGSDRFVFLLCTRAGGLGINLTAADTVIIFDSDWNPQNDLQAQARCHRIGQQKPVKVYRLITRNSYEREMFDKASLKLGLDKAVLQSISGRQDQVANQPPQLSKHEVEDLLKRGAYGAIMDDDDAGNKFCEEDIDQILDRRARTVTLESGEKGSTFSKASFVSGDDRADIQLDDPNFWEKWAKKANLDVDRLKDNKLILASTRNRKQTRRFGGNSDDQEIFAEIGSDSDESAEYDSDANDGSGRKGKFRSRAGGPGGGQRKGWGRKDGFRIEKCLLTYGWGRWSTYQQRGRFGSMISVTELEEMARTVMMYCLKYYNGDDKIKFFVWDLITPQEHAEKAGIDLKNHEGLTATVARGRKGRRNRDEAEKVEDEQSKREWAKDINLDSLLPDEGFKKHIQNQCNKIILRIRMLYYLRTEILNSVISSIDNGTKHEEVEFEMLEKLSDPPAKWWDSTCDKSLLIGVYKHGYEKYNLMRADNLLCFLERAGPPDDRALAAEMDVEPDGDGEEDPEYKPARITFDVDIGDSPAPGTPNTEPSSPVASDTGTKKKDKESKEVESSSSSKKDTGKDWPSVSELNTRLRRIITVYQKHYKQMQQRLMNLHKRNAKAKAAEGGVDMRRALPQTRWTRREEADFYRTVSTFGIERDYRTKDFTWLKFRNIARLDKKTDESLRAYYLAFRRMCEQVCEWKGEPGTSDGTGLGCNEEIPNIVVEPITDERASRTLYRIRLLDKVRCDVLHHPKLKERLKLCQRGPEMPVWWRSGVHDHELLMGMDRYGLTRTEINMLTDKDFTFALAMREYEANPAAVQKKVFEQEKANIENSLKEAKLDEDKKKDSLKSDVKDEVSSEVKVVSTKTEADSTKVEIDSTKEEVDSTKGEVDSTKTEADSTKMEADSTKMEVNSTKTEGDSTKTEGDSTKTEGDSTKTEGDSTKTEGDSTKTEGDSTKTEGDSTKLEGDSTKTEDDFTKREVDSTKMEDDSTKMEIDSTKLEVDSTKMEVDSTKLEVDSTKMEVDSTKMEVDFTKMEDDSTKAEDDSAKAEVDSFKAEVDSFKAEVDFSKTKVDSTKTEDDSTKTEDYSITEDKLGKTAGKYFKDDVEKETDKEEQNVDNSMLLNEEELTKESAEEQKELSTSTEQDARNDMKKELIKSEESNEQDLKKIESQEDTKKENAEKEQPDKTSLKKDRSVVKHEKMEVDTPKTDGTTEKKTKTGASSESQDVKTSQMSLRSKTHPSAAQEYLGFPSMSSPYFVSAMSGRWPKDRVLMLRVEQVCYCVISGEWPKTCQSLLPSMSNSSDSGTPTLGRSQASTPLSEDRGTPVPASFSSSILSNPNDVNLLAANEKQLQAAVAQLLASNEPPRSSSSYRRGRKKRGDTSSATSGVNPLQFPNQGFSQMDKELRRNIEQLMASGGAAGQVSAASLFSPQSTRNEATTSKSSVKTSSSKTLDDTGNSSASLLANLRELATADLKADQGSSNRSRSRTSGFSRHHSPSPSQSRSKESSKSNSDLLKSQQQQQQFMPTPEQLMAMNAPLQQLLQDAVKAGMDPMAAMAAFLPLFPLMDPFQMMNPSKPDNLPQMTQPPMPPPAELEKMLKNMGLTLEMAVMSGLLPASMMPSAPPKLETPKETKSRSEKPKTSDSFTLIPTTTTEKTLSIPEKHTPGKKKGVSKLDSMFGIGKSEEESPGKAGSIFSKKSRKSKFVSPAMLPSDTRIPVHNTSEGIRLSGKDAPLNKDLADWLKDNSGFVVDYQALRQQLDETPKKSDVSSEGGDVSTTPETRKPSVDLNTSDSKQKDILDKAEKLLKTAEKLVEPRSKTDPPSKSDLKHSEEKQAKREFTLPKPVLSSSPASVRTSSSTPTSSSLKQQQQQLSDLALLQQMNAAAGMADPATAAALLGIPPELLHNLTPEMATLLASGLLPGAGFPPEVLATMPGFKPEKTESSRSPSRSSTPSRASPSVRHSKYPPSDPNQLTGDERVTVVNITTGKKLSGKQAPTLNGLAEYLRTYPDYIISSDWSSVLRKSKFLPKDLQTRLLPPRSYSPPKSSSSAQQMSSSNAALAAALGGLPPAAMFPGMGQGMMDPVQLMAALQQMPGQGQLDMKALASAGVPMFPFFGGLPNSMLGAGFGGQDPTMAAMAALSQSLPSPKKDPSSSHESSSADSRGRKPKKGSEKSSGDRGSSGSRSSSAKPSSQQLFGGDPMAEALNALQRSGGLAGMPNPFLPGAANNPLLFPPLMMGGQNVPMDMMSPEILAQLAAFGGLPPMDPPKSSTASSGGIQKREKRRGSSSSTASQKQSSTRSQSRSGGDEQPMDLTQFSGSSTQDRKSPDKHKH